MALMLERGVTAGDLAGNIWKF